MMKRLIAFLLFALTPIISFGAGPLTAVVNDAKQEQKLDKLIDQKVINAMARRLAQSYPDHKEELWQFINDKKEEYNLAGDSEYTNNLYSGFTKFFMLLSRKVFDEIKERELDRLKQYAQSTRREIKEDGNYQWLDRGEYLESDACIPNHWDNCVGENDTFECYEKEAQKWCDYPDGFENYVVYILDEPGFSKIQSSWDDKDKNQTKALIVRWRHAGDEQSQNTEFSYSEHLSSYAEQAEWRNRNRKAMRDGIYLKSTYCGWASTKTDIKCKDIVNKELADFYPNGNDKQPTIYVTKDGFGYKSSLLKSDTKDKDEFDLATKYLLERKNR